jgi:hypothetical protein
MKLSTLMEEENKEKNLDEKLWEFLATHNAPKDSVVHKFAEELGMEADDLEGIIYKVLTSFTTQGKSKGKKNPVDEKELARGKAIEMEHTSDKRISEKIARDHLWEAEKMKNPKYYEMLDLMEYLMKKGVTKDEVLKALNE